MHYPSHHHHHPHGLHPHHHPHGQHYHHHHHPPGSRYLAATPLPNGVSSASTIPGGLVDGQSCTSMGDSQKGPPPLPPKPKILPIKPSNWGHPVTASYATGPGTNGCVNGGDLNGLTMGATGSVPSSGSGAGTSLTDAVITSTSSLHHTNGTNAGVGATTGSNGIANSMQTDLPGNRRSNGATDSPTGLSAASSGISAAVAQARSVYFDQGNSSFV